MRDFAVDSAVTGSDGRLTAILHEGWNVWGPFGGYRAAILLRALAAASPQPRPASFTCTFLATGKPGPVEITVRTRQAGRRASALNASMTQDGTPIMDASGWFVAEGMAGFEHDVTTMPGVPPAEALRGYQDLADDYADWYPFWRNVEGRPLIWGQATGPPIFQVWMRLLRALPSDDPVLEAARQLMWLDVIMWNAVPPPHGWPPKYLAPSLDLTAQFHRGAAEAEWLFCDAAAPIAGAGLAACHGRIWSPSGKLLASGTSHLICRPNPEAG
ncbi:MAG: thioesterase family protein [Candidatus Binatia bacterium]